MVTCVGHVLLCGDMYGVVPRCNQEKIFIKLYDKRNDFDFYVINFPFLDGNIPKGQSYGIFRFLFFSWLGMLGLTVIHLAILF